MKFESSGTKEGFVHFATTKNGRRVLFDTERSHAITHFQKSPLLKQHVEKAISTINAQEDIIRITIDAEEIVGTSDLVETKNTDEIVYARRPLRAQYSRFVKNKQPTPTSKITIDLRKQKANDYILYTAFIGSLTPSFPGGDFMAEQSVDFWSKHALVWGSQEVEPGTETTECPW
jgi:hypothetical protein